MMLYDSENHVYYMGGAAVQSVTQVLPYPDYNRYGNMEYSRELGNYVHSMIHMHLNDILDEDSLDDVLKPYLEAFKKASVHFSDSMVIDIKTGSKHPCHALQVAAYAMLANEGLKADGSVVGEKEFEQPLFHATYKFAGTPDIIFAKKKPIEKAIVLYLHSDGSYDIVDCSQDLKHNIKIFLCFLTTYKWKEENL